MEEQKLSRREREKLQKRQEILATALGLFSQKGCHKVSMQEIAAKAEFAIGTLYTFFRNKEDLYKSMVLEWYDDFGNACKLALEQSDDEVERLRHYMRLREERFHNDLPFVRLCLAERKATSCNLESAVDDEVGQQYCNILKRLASVFGSGIDKKRFKKIVDPFLLALVFDGLIDEWLLLRSGTPKHHLCKKDPFAVVDIFLRGLMAP